MHRFLLTLAFITIAACAQAQTLYKSIGPDGKIVYTDRAPAQNKIEKTLKGEDTQQAALRKNAKPGAMPMTGVVLFSAKWCGYCRQAKAFLAQHGIAYRDIDVDTAEGKLAYARSGGSGGVPVLIANGTMIRGFSTEAYESLFSTH